MNCMLYSLNYETFMNRPENADEIEDDLGKIEQQQDLSFYTRPLNEWMNGDKKMNV